jgi:hypothetical protein
MIGYTGLAEITLAGNGVVQMDSYLAGACCHEPVGTWQPPTHDNDLRGQTMGQLVMRVCRWLDVLERALSVSGGHLLRRQMVQFIGFRRDRRRRANPFSFVIEWDRNRRGFWYRSERLLHSSVQAPQVTLAPRRGVEDSQRISEYLQAGSGEPAQLLAHLAGSLGGFTHLPGVGSDFLVLCLEPSKFRIHTFFASASGDFPVVATPSGDVAVHALPWLVSPGLSQPPFLTNLRVAGQEGHLQFELHGLPESPTALVAVPLERTRRVGVLRHELPREARAIRAPLTAGRHTVELRGETDPRRHL